MRWFFDFISPYAYLQSTRLDALTEVETVECVPVLFGAMLNHWGTIGPAELAPKRRWTYEHVAWAAHRDGIPLKMPARHPFNPLALLRLAATQGNNQAAVQRIFRWVWAEGNSPEDKTALAALCAEFKVSEADLAAPVIKDAIKGNTEQAIANDIFGVPTTQYQGQNFWGNEATEMILTKALAKGDESVYPAAAMTAAAATGAGISRTQATPTATPASHSIEPRLPYKPLDLAEPADLVAAVRKRRGGDLLELDRILLYSPPLTEGWNVYLNAVRTKLSVSPKLGELVISTVAVLNRADFEFGQHAPLFMAAGGTQAQTDALSEPQKAAANAELFLPAERAALQLCIEMTTQVQVSDTTFAECRKHIDDQAVVELVATIAAYNMVSRFLVAINVHAQPARS